MHEPKDPAGLTDREWLEVGRARADVSRQFGRLGSEEFGKMIARARTQRAGLVQPARSRADPDRPIHAPADIVGDGAKRVRVGIASGKMPATFGSTGVFVEVRSDEAFRPVTLRIRLTDRELRQIEPETMLVARWDARAMRSRLIPQSGWNATRGYAFARITRPGVYTAIGVPRDPLARSTLELARSLLEWPLPDKDVQLTQKICGLILCDPGVTGGGGTSDLCAMCLGIDDWAGLPELRLLDIVNGGQIAPGLPWYLPRPCPGWLSFGPDNVPGRINALATDPASGQILYAGSAAGGVFRSTNAGATWSAMWSGELSLAIGGLAVAPSDASVIYASTGEWDVSASAMYVMYPGVGVYRSPDSGIHWDLRAPIPSTETAAVAVHPTDPARVFVAGKRGLHRSTNGGSTWDILPGNAYGVFDGEVSDVVVDPNDGDRVYIGVHHSAAKTGGVYRSTNGGNTWTHLTNGISSGTAADGPKIALGRNGIHGTQFVAVKMSNQVFTSVDGGNTFTQKPTNAGFLQQTGRYMNVIAVDPTDESTLFGGDLHLFRSANGGNSWTNVSTAAPTAMNRIHADLHAVAFDPTSHNTIFVGSDGGIYASTDNGNSWTATHGYHGIQGSPFVSNGLSTLQCWTVAVSQGSRFALAVTSHDNHSFSWHTGTTFVPLNYLGRGEGGWVEYDPGDPDVVYEDNWSHNIMKSVNGTAWWQQQAFTDLGIDTSNLNMEALAIAWTNTSRLLATRQPSGALARSTNAGTTWTNVLTVPNDEVSACAFAPSSGDHAYAGTASGRIWHSVDGGATWTELAQAGLPGARVHDIEVDWDDPLRVYLAFGTRGALGSVGYRQLWRGDIGVGTAANWSDASGGLAAVSLPDLGITGLVLDPSYDDTIYVSNIVGVYRSVDGGDSWHPFDEGLPNTFVSDLDLRKVDRWLYASTMGRGVFRRKV